MSETLRVLDAATAYQRPLLEADAQAQNDVGEREEDRGNRTSQVELITPSPTLLRSYPGIANHRISREIQIHAPEDQKLSSSPIIVTQRNAIYRSVSLVLDAETDLRELDLIRTGTALIVEEHDPRQVDLQNDPHDFQGLVRLYRAAGLEHILPKVIHILRPFQDQPIQILEADADGSNATNK